MSDPHYHREAEKYESPIPSREHILSFIQDKPKSKRQLFELLSLEDDQKKAFERRLRAMVRDKQLSCNKSGVYRPFSNRGLHRRLGKPTDEPRECTAAVRIM